MKVTMVIMVTILSRMVTAMATATATVKAMSMLTIAQMKIASTMLEGKGKERRKQAGVEGEPKRLSESTRILPLSEAIQSS